MNRPVRGKPLILFCLLLASIVFTAQSRDLTIYKSTGVNTTALDQKDISIILETEKIRTAFTSFGTFGRLSGWFNFNGTTPGFETPVNSSKQYLFWGGLWVGGVVDNDTIVVTGIDGWTTTFNEFIPPTFPEPADISSFKYGLFDGYRTEFVDTITSVPDYFFPMVSPLHLDVALRAFIYPSETTDDIILYDLVLTNIGASPIKNMYTGLYLDADIAHSNDRTGFIDDFSGSIRSHGIAYMIDNDGNLNMPDSFVTPHAMAVKLTYASQPILDSNFNWWFSSMTYTNDFGPRLKPTPEDPYYDFGTGGTGTPVGDTNKYYILSHKEWDYDTPMISTITENDSLWMYPGNDFVIDFAYGYDARFLLSFGPVDLAPDSSVRFIFANYIGDNVHMLPDNLNNIPDKPMTYLNNLNYANIIYDAMLADTLTRAILNPDLPVLGFHTVVESNDSVTIKWDPTEVDGCDGYTLYLSEIPQAWLPYPGLAPPWLKPFYLNKFADLGKTNNYMFDSLNRDNFYFVNIANRTVSGVGDEGKTLVINMRERESAPIPGTEYTFFEQDSTTTFSWQIPPNTPIDHFNIYKFSNIEAYSQRYNQFYSKSIEPDKPVEDIFYTDDGVYYYYAMNSYATIPAQINQFEDSEPLHDYVYAISFVDSAGFESEFSSPITTQIMPPKENCILFMTHSFISPYSFTIPDSIISFYQTILQGYDYDIYDINDTVQLYGCDLETSQCFDLLDLASYKYIIIDDDAREKILQCEAELYTKSFTRYILSGGTLLYFGNFAQLYNFGFNSSVKFYPNSNEFTRLAFGFDSVYYYPYTYYYPISEPPFIDSLFGFKNATPAKAEYPVISYDSARHPLVNFEAMSSQLWPTETPPSVGVFKPSSNAQVLYTFNSMFPNSSRIQNEPVGIKTEVGFGSTYLFGFHLWYMDYPNAQQLLSNIILGVSTDINDPIDPSLLPDHITLHQNYPNPFNPSTTIAFELPRQTEVTLEIFNLLGQKVTTLVDRQALPAGIHEILWDGLSTTNQPVASGIYLYRLTVNDQKFSKKMLLLK